MATSYHVYGNDGQGGPIDYDRPIATIAAAPAGSGAPLATTLGPLATPSDNRFAVRAFDDVSGVEEANTDATARLVLDAAGRDISAQPNPAVGLAARWSAGDLALVWWGYQAAGQGGVPDHFEVFAAPAGATPDAGPPARSVPFVGGVAAYGCSLSGLAGTSGYTVLVRAVGPSGLAGAPTTVPLPAQGGALVAVDALQAVATP